MMNFSVSLSAAEMTYSRRRTQRNKISTLINCPRGSFTNCLEAATTNKLKAFEFYKLHTDLLCSIKVQFA